MDIPKMVHQDSTLDEASREFDGTLRADNLQNPDRRNSFVVPCTSRSGSCDNLRSGSYVEPPSTKDEIEPPSTKDEIMALGYPSYENIFEGHCFLNSFNFEYGVSNWVSECLTLKQRNKFYINRNNVDSSFFEDEEIDLARRVTLDDYHNSGYHKGHLAAAGNHRYNYNAYRSTFCLRNIAPMYAGVNSILNKIENQGRDFVLTKEKVYIVTGTVFRHEREPIFVKEGSKLRVPDAFFKVLVHEDTHRSRSIHRVFAYMVENKPDDHEDIKKALKDIKHAKRRLSYINGETGLNILSEVNKREIIDDYGQNQRTSRFIGSL